MILVAYSGSVNIVIVTEAEPLPSPVRPGGIIDLTRTYGSLPPAPVPSIAQTAAPQLMSPAASLAYRQG